MINVPVSVLKSSRDDAQRNLERNQKNLTQAQDSAKNALDEIEFYQRLISQFDAAISMLERK